MKVFISYAHADDDLRQELVTHLAQLRRDGLIEEWHDRRITGGQKWAGQIDAHLESADIVLLLISPDFIASDYCYDKELARALERHQEDRARVIPVILRPTDWQSAPFGQLQAFPKDGKPIIKWEPRDDGFLEVARGLRKVVAELSGRAPAGPDAQKALLVPPRRGRLKWAVAVAILAAAVAAGVGWWWRQHAATLAAERQQLATAQTCMQKERYADAEAAYARALEINPASGRAAFGLKKAALMEWTGDPETLGIELDALLKQAPEDPDLLLLDGLRLYLRHDRGWAVQRFEKVLSLRPQSARAHFRLGMIKDQDGRIEDAMDHYAKAVDLSPDTAMYRNNLAYLYYKQGEYERAIEQYSRIARYPLAGLELAKAAWMLGDLQKAIIGQQRALEWLEDPRVASLPKNQGPWYFEAGAKKLRVLSLTEKICCARLALSATLFLLGRTADCDARYQQAAAGCPTHIRDLKQVLQTDLALVRKAQPRLAARIDAYGRRYLTE